MLQADHQDHQHHHHHGGHNHDHHDHDHHHHGHNHGHNHGGQSCHHHHHHENPWEMITTLLSNKDALVHIVQHRFLNTPYRMLLGYCAVLAALCALQLV